MKTLLTALAVVLSFVLVAPTAEAGVATDRAVAYAKTRVGKDKAQDCSLFVQRAFARGGVKLPRTTYQQYRKGKAVSTKQSAWKKGDLIFTHGGGHVMVYDKSGYAYHDPGTKRLVNRQAVKYMGKIYKVRRVA